MDEPTNKQKIMALLEEHKKFHKRKMTTATDRAYRAVKKAKKEDEEVRESVTGEYADIVQCRASGRWSARESFHGHHTSKDFSTV